jgi:RimJ/RimL family protein N-acetyltransferase
MRVSFPLTTDRLLIAPMIERDAAAFAAYRSEPEVARFQSWAAPYPLAEALEVLAGNPRGWPAAGGWAQLGVYEAGALRGDVAVHAIGDPIAPDTVELGITLSPDAQGRGIATEALRAVVDACFAAGAHRVYAVCDARNEPVARLLQRLGLRREARLVDAEWWKGEWTTADTWAVLAGERAA